MAEKDIRKLKRQDLLELLILQSREVIRLQTETEAQGDTIKELTETNDRLKERLNEKDAQMDDQNARLTGRLNDKDAQMGRLTAKLGEKDQQIERLKTKLDQKDAKILKLEAMINTGASRDPDEDNTDLMMERIYEAAQLAVGDFLKRQAGEHESGLPAYMTGVPDEEAEQQPEVPGTEVEDEAEAALSEATETKSDGETEPDEAGEHAAAEESGEDKK